VPENFKFAEAPIAVLGSVRAKIRKRRTSGCPKLYAVGMHFKKITIRSDAYLFGQVAVLVTIVLTSESGSMSAARQHCGLIKDQPKFR
jgi:hypothetical protein